MVGIDTNNISNKLIDFDINKKTTQFVNALDSMLASKLNGLDVLVEGKLNSLYDIIYGSSFCINIKRVNRLQIQQHTLYTYVDMLNKEQGEKRQPRRENKHNCNLVWKYFDDGLIKSAIENDNKVKEISLLMINGIFISQSICNVKLLISVTTQAHKISQSNFQQFNDKFHDIYNHLLKDEIEEKKSISDGGKFALFDSIKQVMAVIGLTDSKLSEYQITFIPGRYHPHESSRRSSDSWVARQDSYDSPPVQKINCVPCKSEFYRAQTPLVSNHGIYQIEFTVTGQTGGGL